MNVVRHHELKPHGKCVLQGNLPTKSVPYLVRFNQYKIKLPKGKTYRAVRDIEHK